MYPRNRFNLRDEDPLMGQMAPPPPLETPELRFTPMQPEQPIASKLGQVGPALERLGLRRDAMMKEGQGQESDAGKFSSSAVNAARSSPFKRLGKMFGF